MRSIRTRAALALTIAAALATSGCGGSSALSKDELAAKANAACAPLNPIVAAPPSDLSTNAAAAAAYLDKLVPAVAHTISQIKALKPGSGQKADFDAFVSLANQELGFLRTGQTKAHAKDQTGLQSLQQARTVASQAKTLATGLGWTTCAAGQ